MDFDFSPEQKEIQHQANRLLSERCDLRAVRRVLEGEAPYDRELWRQVAELGWLGVAVPEEYGGLGMPRSTLCVIAEELGRALAPLPVCSSMYLAAEAILQAGDETQKRELLPSLISGERIATLAAAEGIVGATAFAQQQTRVVDGGLSGTKVPVPDGMVADWAVVSAGRPAQPDDDCGLYLVDLNGPGVRRSALQTLDPTRPQALIEFKAAPAQALGAAEGGAAALRRTLDRAAVLVAFEQVGGADAALAMSAEYAKIRQAFGRAIGSFQAIKHKLADMYTRNQLARSNAWFAAWALDASPADLPLAAAAARIAACEAFEFAAKESIQTHGGIGATWEGDMHLFYRRAKSLGVLLDGPAGWRNRLVDALQVKATA
ncbi:acyl-CoA dehydrogenase family protein [Piscinibacter sp.]|jgi:acyl-CoA dehydrogenase|uniref:acyl-CoA dehydrogenase family protein n=1 Tax=Piscinibacter sp. TaxID=1903157 RepID=UPI00355AB298